MYLTTQILSNQGALGFHAGSSRAAALLCYLSNRQGRGPSTWVNRDTICKALGWNPYRLKQFDEAVQELVDRQLIVIEDKLIPNTKTVTTHYDCRPTLGVLKRLGALESKEESQS